ncbi:MAG: dihydroneopterin aldolase [bacterium]
MWRFEEETVYIDNLRLECIIGVHPEERERVQPLLISLSFPLVFAKAAATESLSETVDYSAVAGSAREFAIQGSFQLLETLARELGVHLCERFGLSSIRMTLKKPAAIADSDGAAVSLTVHRARGGAS